MRINSFVRGLVRRVLVQPDLADAEHPRLAQELGDHGDHLAGQLHVLRFLGVDAQPRVVPDVELGRPFRLHLGQVAEVVVEPGGGAAVEPGPERRLGDGHAPGVRHPGVVVGGAGDHVNVRVDVAHRQACQL
jgi:hypothetical protein